MVLGLYDTVNSSRDPSFDQTVLVSRTLLFIVQSTLNQTIQAHELFHGVTNRLAGGPKNPYCMAADEETGMVNEGFSDTFAWLLSMNASMNRQTDRVIGGYVEGNFKNGVRRYPVCYLSFSYFNPFCFY
jgi:extracellular elastinolytic metalloproteinase